MSDITSSHIVYESARARELLKEAVAVELLIAEGAYPEGVSARVVMQDGERVDLMLAACSFSAAVCSTGKLVLTLTDGSEVTWCRPLAPGDRMVAWEKNAGPVQASAGVQTLTLPTRLRDLARDVMVTPASRDVIDAALDVIDAGIAMAGLQVRRPALQGPDRFAWSKSVFGDAPVTVPVEPAPGAP